MIKVATLAKLDDIYDTRGIENCLSNVARMVIQAWLKVDF